jgi:hypothetical protein
MSDRDDEKTKGGRDEDDKPPKRIIIEDKRFSRDDEDDDERDDEPVASLAAETVADTAKRDEERDHAELSDARHVAESERRRLEVMEDLSIPFAADPTADIPIEEDFPDEDAFRELTPEDEERLRKAAQAQLAALSKIGIENYLREIFNVAYVLSLQYLGLQPNPNTGLTVRDIKRATLCIDVIDYLRRRLDDNLAAAEKTQLSQLVAALQIEYSKIIPPPKPPKE